ncbi:MAG: WYL domain-containing protein [Spirochaetaceae bacterium]|jgi:predicted DNA-binding transcriptional regulator YafY|nr:WYL domain-containing protein [Spirochaetaceae bacterium]
METRKHLPRAVLARIYFIDREIAAGKFPNVHDLAKEYEVGTATIYRDIEYMRYMLNAPIEYSAKNRGWYYTEKAFRLPAGFAAANDMLTLGMAKSLVALYKNTPLYEPALRLLNSITAPLSEENEDAGKTAWYEKRIVVPPVAQAYIDTGIWSIIAGAIKENKKITFEYKGYIDDDFKTRIVHPYQLLFDNGAWFLYAYSEERSAIRIFSLTHIKNAAITNEHFILPEEFDYCASNDDSFFGVFAGKKESFKIAFNRHTANNIQDRLWAKDQKIYSKNNKVIIEFTSSQYDKVLSWVLSFGSGARPLKPDQLVDQWKEQIIELYKILGK